MTGCRTFAILGLLASSLVHPLPGEGLARIDTERGKVERESPRVPVVLEGIVFDPHGAPAEGVVVVSSAGGQALTDHGGRYRLAVGVPVEARGLRVTAVGGEGGQLVASASVELAGAAQLTRLQPLQLAREGACQPSWLPTFGGEPGTDTSILSLVVFDDGGGPALYAGGSFREAGGVAVRHIVKWDGSRWSPLGIGTAAQTPATAAPVHALAVFDDGSGPALYAGGRFHTAGGNLTNNIAKWDGASWTTLDTGVVSMTGFATVYALAVFDDGSGPALYAGGDFTTAGGVPANHVARWNGSTWAPLGDGTTSAPSTPATVYALTVFDDGSGPALYAGGPFTTAGGVAASGIAKWNGSSWSPLGAGVGGASGARVLALSVFDDGNGLALYAGGDFHTAGGQTAENVARWDGSSWSALGSGMAAMPTLPFVEALLAFDDGSGPALYAAGHFTTAGGVAASCIARWNGSSWSALGDGVGASLLPRVVALAEFDTGSGPALFAGGTFASAGDEGARNLAQWQASRWSVVGLGMTAAVDTLAVLDDGTGQALYAGGDFTTVGGVEARHVARWDGSSWSPLESGMAALSPALPAKVHALAAFDGGDRPALYAGGVFRFADGVVTNNVAQWDGARWQALGSGIAGSVFALLVFDDGGGPALYAAGSFPVAGGTPARHIARWNGSSWSPLGSGMSAAVHALAVFDDGSGPALYAGGEFTTAGGVAASHIARWNGSSWAPLGSGTDDTVLALAVFDDGSGPALHAGGEFTTAGGAAASHVAKWDGASWTALGSGAGGAAGERVSALAVHDDGSGPALFAGGRFALAGGTAVNQIARWDGSSWTPLGSGLGDGSLPEVRALTPFNDRTGLALHAGGSFRTAFDSGDSYLAKWGCPDTSAPVITCPAAIVVDDRTGDRPGEIVTFAVTVVDAEDPSPSLVCNPPSGSRFPRGTTLVTCTATDFTGNQTSCEFTVTVGAKPPKHFPGPSPR